jgi:hypothetical protein
VARAQIRRMPLDEAMARNIAPGSTAGLPGLVLPAGLTTSGLPVAISSLALGLFEAASGVLRIPADNAAPSAGGVVVSRRLSTRSRPPRGCGRGPGRLPSVTAVSNVSPVYRSKP